MKISRQLNFRVGSSKTAHIFSNFFIFILIFVSISQESVKNQSKFLASRFSWKLVYHLMLGWRVQKSYLFPKIFPFFASISQKSVKNASSTFFLRLSWKLACNVDLGWRVQISYLFSVNFSSLSLFLPWLLLNQSNVSQKDFPIFSIDIQPDIYNFK